MRHSLLAIVYALGTLDIGKNLAGFTRVCAGDVFSGRIGVYNTIDPRHLPKWFTKVATLPAGGIYAIPRLL